MLELALFWVGIAIVVVALLMLFSDAFKRSKGWGIAGLLLLIPLFVHIVMAWTSLTVRKATYALIIGILTVLVSIAGGVLAHLPFLTQHEVVQTLEENIAPPKDTPLPNEEQVQAITDPAEEGYDPVLSGSEFEEVDIEKYVPPSETPVVATAAARYVPVSIEDLPGVINKRVRLSMQDGEVVEGTLTHIEQAALTVESAVEGGSLGLSYKVSEIKSIAVRLAQGEDLPVKQESADPAAMSPNDQALPADEMAVPMNEPTNLEPADQALSQPPIDKAGVDDNVRAPGEDSSQSPENPEPVVEQ